MRQTDGSRYLAFAITGPVLTREIAGAADSPGSAAEPSSRRRILRRVLVVAVVVLVLGIVVFAAISGLAADPMTGT